MKKIKVFKLFLIAICMVGCTQSEEPEMKSETMSDSWWTVILKMFGISDETNEETAMTSMVGQYVILNCIDPESHKHMFMMYDTVQARVIEKIVGSQIPAIKTFHKGYGEYKDYIFNKFGITKLAFTTEGFVGLTWALYGNVRSDYNNGGAVTYFIYSDGKTKAIKELEDERLLNVSSVYSWYNNTVLFELTNEPSLVYSDKGEFVRTFDEYIHGNWHDYKAISYTECIAFSGSTIKRIDFSLKLSKSEVWGKNFYACASIPNNSKCEYEILSTQGNIWKCVAPILYYDGTKKDINFTLDIDNGNVTIE